MDKYNWLLAVFLTIIIISSAFFSVFYDRNMPDLSLSYGIYGTKVTDFMHKDVFDYLYYGGSMDLRIFTDAERSHMQDVRKQILRIHYIFFGALMLTGLLLYRFDRFGINVSFFKNYSILTLIGVVFSVFVVLWFPQFFNIFHKIFFVSNYTFPLGSPLVSMYTYEYFKSAALRIFGVWVTSGIFSTIIWHASKNRS
jgi:uncharacterized membrane protein